MKKNLIRLTESDLNRIVKNSVRRAIKEGAIDEGFKDTLKDTALGVGLGTAAAAGMVGTDNPISRGLDRQYERHVDDMRARPEDREEMNRTAYFDDFRKDLEDDGIDTSRIKGESRINRAISESITKFINEISTDTRDEASKKAFRKYLDSSEKYGNADPRTKHAKDQYNTFSNSYGDEYVKGNTAKKARMDKNREDRESGKRTYVKGKGWRTQQDGE